MKTPTYWKDKNIVSDFLSPLGRLYNLATRMRIKHKRPRKAPCPVICVGNLTAGGTGKTPVAIALSKLLSEAGYHPYFVSRGYGGTLHNIVVDNQKHTAAQTGDEPLLLSRYAPVVVNPDRFQGAMTACSYGADLIIMDDGFQNPGLFKDLSFLVFDGSFGIGNGRCIPAGPLREDFGAGLKRADAAIIIGSDLCNLESRLNIPTFAAEIRPIKAHRGTPHIIAFAGIGRPEKFYQSLRSLNFNLLHTYDFPDHHIYTEDDLQTLIRSAERLQAEIYTTTKDFVKIPPQLQSKFKVLDIEILWQDPQALQQFILSKIR